MSFAFESSDARNLAPQAAVKAAPVSLPEIIAPPPPSSKRNALEAAVSAFALVLAAKVATAPP